jgi:hypothetical protein
MRKYLIILSTIFVLFIFYYEKNVQNQTLPINKEKINKSITEALKKDDILINKNQIIIKSGNYCSWTIKEDYAYGIYTKKSFFPKIIVEKTKLKVEWVTNKKVMLPGLANSIQDQDTVICLKTPTNKEIYIVIVKGKNIKTINKRNKTHYTGEVEMANMENLLDSFSFVEAN